VAVTVLLGTAAVLTATALLRRRPVDRPVDRSAEKPAEQAAVTAGADAPGRSTSFPDHPQKRHIWVKSPRIFAF
jgi:hypothetical protein